MMKYSEVVISAFATYTKTTDLVKATGLSKNTIVRYKKDTHLMEIANERRCQIVKGSVYKMQGMLSKCVDTFERIIDDPDVNPQTKVYAINSLMNHCREFTLTVDIIERLEALERKGEDE